jgi:tetratricopeptide (TPR) repeat protein
VQRGGRRPQKPRKSQTAAERRAAEVNAKRPKRPPRDPDAERSKIESRSVEQWIDEGALRAEAAHAATRAAAAPRRPKRQRAVAPDTAAAIAAGARDARRAAALTARLAQAQEALDRERFDEARRIASALVRELPNVAAAHEVLGLAAYRSGRWKQAATSLEASQQLHPTIELLPVLADAYRALRRWDDVERIWEEVRAASPAADVLAEARIVAAGAQADQGDLRGALRTMRRAEHVPPRVRDHHLRQWYALADLHDRAGDTLDATRWFELVARHDSDFVDVVDRLRALGR